MATRTRAACAATGLVLLVTGAAPVGAGPARPVPCQVVGTSPRFAQDRTMFCLSGSGPRGFDGPVTLVRSNDAGRTWSAPMRIGAGGAGHDFPVWFATSPGYPADRTLFVSTYAGGGFVSTDDGTSFRPLSPGAIFAAPTTTTFLDGAPGGAQRPAVITTDGADPLDWRYDPAAAPAGRPVAPPPEGFVTWRYLVPPDFAATRQAVVIGRANLNESSPSYGPLTGHSKVLACAEFVCGRVLYDFPPTPGETDTYATFTGTTYTGSPDTYVVTVSDYDKPSTSQVFRSRDHGRTWARWESVTALLRGTYWTTDAYLGASPDNPKRLFLRVSGENYTTEAQPQEQLFRSDDDGRTWRRIGHAWGPKQRVRGARSTLPWNTLGFGYSEPFAGPGGRLYLVGEQRNGDTTAYLGLYCSRDYGRTWRKGCS